MEIGLSIATARRRHDVHHSFERWLTGAGIDHINANVELPPPFQGDIHTAEFRSWLNVDGDRLFSLARARVIGPLAGPNVVRPRGNPIEPVLAAIVGTGLGDSVEASISL